MHCPKCGAAIPQGGVACTCGWSGLSLPEGANIDGMAVCVPLVFACEAHREAWLTRNGVFDGPHGDARHADYVQRKNNTLLIFTVGAEVRKL